MKTDTITKIKSVLDAIWQKGDIMAQREVQIGDEIEFMGKKYRAESEEKTNSCVGCAFYGLSPCPVDENCINGNCITGSLIFKEVKETPRHLELGVVKVEGDNVTFKIIEQTHRGGEFTQRGSFGIFKASNGLGLASRCHPEWEDDNHLLYCRGRACEKDDKELNCTVVDFARISEAVNEYNITDGKGYEKPWPQWDDRYFFVSERGKVDSNCFEEREFDYNLKEIGNFFRTEDEAEAAAEKIKALFKKMAERKK